MNNPGSSADLPVSWVGITISARQILLDALDDAHLHNGSSQPSTKALILGRSTHAGKEFQHCDGAHHEASLASDAVKACHGKLVYCLNAKVHWEVCQRLQHPGVYIALVDAPLHKQCSWVTQQVMVALQGCHPRQVSRSTNGHPCAGPVLTSSMTSFRRYRTERGRMSRSTLPLPGPSSWTLLMMPCEKMGGHSGCYWRHEDMTRILSCIEALLDWLWWHA